MTIEFAIKGLVVAALVILAYWAFRRFQAPRPRTERLAMTVWAAFGPYDTAEFVGERSEMGESRCFRTRRNCGT
jgi:hypothetical protein